MLTFVVRTVLFEVSYRRRILTSNLKVQAFHLHHAPHCWLNVVPHGKRLLDAILSGGHGHLSILEMSRYLLSLSPV